MMSEPVAKQRPMIDLDEFERRLRRPASPSRRDDDPLAELARLVGTEEDPFKNVFDHQAKAQGGRNGTWEPSLGTPGGGHPLAGNFAAIEAGLRGSMQPEAHESEMAPPVAHSAPHPDYAQPDYAGADQHWAPEAPLDNPREHMAGRSRRPLYLMGAVILLGIAGIGASFAYKGHVSGPREIATIRALPGPTKIQPENPGGTEVSNQDASILDKAPQPTTVAAVDHEEQPVDLSQIHVSAPALSPAPTAEAAPHGAASVPVPPTPAQMEQPLSIAALIEPKKVKTVSVRPDGTLLPNDTPPHMSASAPTRPAAPSLQAKVATPKSTARAVTTPRLKSVATAERDNPNAPLQLMGGPNGRSAPAGRPVHVAAAEEGTATTAGGNFAVQFAAPASEHDARVASAGVQKKYASQLGGYHPSIHKAKIGAKEVYRVRVAGLSREAAAELCKKVQTGGGKCFVAKN